MLLEAAVRNTILQLRGIDSLEEFIGRQQAEVLAQEALALKTAQRPLLLDDDPSI